jgi:uncharacterized membrane protein
MVDSLRVPAIKPCEPFSSWPIQTVLEGFGFAWVLPGAIFVTHSTANHQTEAMATAIIAWTRKMLAAHGPEIDAAGGYLAFQDWRTVRAYDSAARGRWLEAIRGARAIRAGVVVVGGRNPLMRLFVTAADLALSTGIRKGAKIEMSDDIEKMLTKYKVPNLGV